MKKITVSVMVLGVLLTSIPAHALTLSDLQKEIEILKQEIASLKGQLSGNILGAITNTPVTYTTYSYGMKSSGLIPLQQKLIDQKYLVEGNATGTYGMLTYNAVKSFQQAKGLKVDGVLGSQTQSLLMGGETGVTCRTPITVLSPNGGEFYQAGQKITVTWKTCENIPATAAVRIDLEAWGAYPAFFFVNTINDGTEVVTLPTTTNMPGMQYGLGYKVAVTYFPKVMTNSLDYYRDFSDNLFTISTACTPNSWKTKADFGGIGRHSATGFSIGEKGYVGTGFGNAKHLKDFWEYNSAYNTWTQKADFGGEGRSNAASFSIDGKGYLGTGRSSTAENFSLNDFWSYDPVTNTWTKKADFPGGKRSSAVGFSIGDKGYIGTGQSPVGTEKDLWEYSPSLDQWTKKADMVGGARSNAQAFSVGNKGYVGTGHTGNSSSVKKDFWEYSPATNTWSQKADFGGEARESASSFSLLGKGYIGGGHGATGLVSDFWAFDPAANTWTKKANILGPGYLTAGFSINNRGYLTTGAASKIHNQYCPD